MSLLGITRLAGEIDSLDEEIVVLLSKRFRRSREIGLLKRQSGAPAFNQTRVSSQKEGFVASCRKAGLDEPMARALITLIIDQVIAERVGESAR